MFVRSRVDKPMTFRKNGKSWVIKPGTITLIDDPRVTAKELKGCYGSRIDVISEEGSYTSTSKGRQSSKNVVQYKKEVATVKVEKAPATKIDETLDNILAEVNKELDNGNKKVDTSESERPAEHESSRSMDGNISGLGNAKNGEEATKGTGVSTEEIGKKEEEKVKPVQVKKATGKAKTASNKTVAKKTTVKRKTKNK